VVLGILALPVMLLMGNIPTTSQQPLRLSNAATTLLSTLERYIKAVGGKTELNG